LEIVSTEDTEYLLVLTDKQQASKEDFENKRDAIKKNIITKKRFDLISAWRETLWKQAESNGEIKIEPQYL